MRYLGVAVFLIPAAGTVGLLAGFVAAAIKRRGVGEMADYLFFLRLRMPTALLAGVVLGLPIWLNLDVPAANYIAAVSLLAITYGAAINYHITGMWIIALGTGANLIVLLANGAIPVDAGALAAAGVLDNATIDQVVFGTGRQLATDGDYFGWLGAVIGVRALGDAITFGDLITAAGLTNVTFRLLWPLGSALDRVLPPPVETPADELADYASDLARPHETDPAAPQPEQSPANEPAKPPVIAPAANQPLPSLAEPVPTQPALQPPFQPGIQPPFQPGLRHTQALRRPRDTEQLEPATSAAQAPAAFHVEERTQLMQTTSGNETKTATDAAGSASHRPG